jgi:hypothetical protein
MFFYRRGARSARDLGRKFFRRALYLSTSSARGADFRLAQSVAKRRHRTSRVMACEVTISQMDSGAAA